MSVHSPLIFTYLEAEKLGYPAMFGLGAEEANLETCVDYITHVVSGFK